MSGHFTHPEKNLLNIIANNNHKAQADWQALLKIKNSWFIFQTVHANHDIKWVLMINLKYATVSGSF